MRAKRIEELLEMGMSSLEISADHSVEDLIELINSANRMLKKGIDPLLHTKSEYKKARKEALNTLKKKHKLSQKEIDSRLDEGFNKRIFLGEAFDVLTWSRKNLSADIADQVEEAHEGGFGEKLQTSLLKVANKEELLQWYNRNFEVGEIQEAVDFKRTGDTKKSLDLGDRVANRDPETRLGNFKADHPEVGLAYNSESQLHAPGSHPKWKILNISLNDPEDPLSVNIQKYLSWVQDHTDFDIVELEHSSDRKYHPWGDPKNPEHYSQSIAIRMRNEEDVS